MKKFFEKYDLLKLAGIFGLISVILTWVVPAGYYQSEMVIDDINRVGIGSFFQYGLYVGYFFFVLVTFLFVLGGFYEVLSKRAGYQELIKKISTKLEKVKVPFVLIVTFIFAILSSMVIEYFPLLAFIPFIIAIYNRMKVDKMVAFASTFGGLLVGTIGSTYSAKVAGQLTTTFTSTGNLLVTQTVLFVISYLLLSAFIILRMKKEDKKFKEYDKFANATQENGKKKVRTWPYIIGIIIFAVTVILGYLPWETWEVTLFEDITKSINEFTIGDVPILTYIYGTFIPFGKTGQGGFDIFQVQFIMLFATILMHLFGKVSLDKVFEDYGIGFKKISKEVVVLLFVYFILAITYSFPTFPVIADWLVNMKEGFSVPLTFIITLLTSLFGVEMQYVTSLIGTYFAATYSEAHTTLAVMFQSIWGFVSFFAPSSAILMLGLSYLDIPYKDWMKFIWKFLLIMLVIIVIIIVIVA